MTDDLDPKLREFEAKLRRLKPLQVGCRPPGGNVGDSRPAPGRRIDVPVGYRRPIARRSIAYLLTAAVAVLALVCLLPLQQPPEQASEPLLPSAVSCLPSPSMRQQLAELLDEMNVAELPTVKPEYPVVEIVVQTTAPQIATPTFERIRWRMDEEMLLF